MNFDEALAQKTLTSIKRAKRLKNNIHYQMHCKELMDQMEEIASYQQSAVLGKTYRHPNNITMCNNHLLLSVLKIYRKKKGKLFSFLTVYSHNYYYQMIRHNTTIKNEIYNNLISHDDVMFGGDKNEYNDTNYDNCNELKLKLIQKLEQYGNTHAIILADELKHLRDGEEAALRVVRRNKAFRKVLAAIEDDFIRNKKK